MLNKIDILGIHITNEPKVTILEYSLKRLRDATKKFVIVTPNPEIVIYANKHPRFKKLLNEAEIALPDGIGLLFAGVILGKSLTQRFTGIDFIEELCSKCRDNPLSIGFLGGRGNVAKRTAECLKNKYPWIVIRYIGEEWNEKEYKKPFDILFVALGFPKQEEWIFSNLDRIPVTCAMGVGGSFDYISGEVMRAPYIIRRLGFEWLFRLIRQPWRVKRQLALLEFSFLIIKELFKRKKN